MTLHIREFREEDRDHVVALWSLCELTRPWNDPDDSHGNLSLQAQMEYSLAPEKLARQSSRFHLGG